MSKNETMLWKKVVGSELRKLLAKWISLMYPGAKEMNLFCFLCTPVFWPGEFHGLYSSWGRKESDMTEWLSLSVKWSEQNNHLEMWRLNIDYK